MDMEQENLQFLGLFGIMKESYKLIFTCRKIFSLIALTLILPFTITLLVYQKISDLLESKIMRDDLRLMTTDFHTHERAHLSHLLSTERAIYALISIAYFTLVLAFSLLATAAVVYTIARLHTSRETTSFKDVARIIPTVWKRLIVTFLCAFLAFFAYNAVLAAAYRVWLHTISDTTAGDVTLIVMLIVYACGFIYLTIVWQLGSVVSVLEDSYGFKAMIKSVDLIKGKRWIAIAVFFELNFVFVGLVVASTIYLELIKYMAVAAAWGFGALLVLFSMKMILFGLVMQTVLYFVCKSYHHESIDKFALGNRLEGYLGDYVPLKKDVQMQEVEDRV